jgi:hypothetical protein
VTKIEQVARSVARKHFMRKQHAGACTQDERVGYLVDQYWRNFEGDARDAIAAMREPIGLMCMHNVTMSENPSQTCVCHTAFNQLIDAALQPSFAIEGR